MKKICSGLLILALIFTGCIGEGPEETAAPTTLETTIAASTTIVQTTLPPVTTTVEQTTSSVTSTSTTTSLSVVCTLNSDCGVPYERRICHKGDVVIQNVAPICRRSGTPEANCIQNVYYGSGPGSQPQVVDICSGNKTCVNGNCIVSVV